MARNDRDREREEESGGAAPAEPAMGRISRFAEPMILLLLSERGRAHGYELIAAVGEEPPLCGEESAMDSAAVYRALRSMEEAGFLVSSWATEGGGPARRVYGLTPLGAERLAQWVERLGRMAEAMRAFVERGRRLRGPAGAPGVEGAEGSAGPAHLGERVEETRDAEDRGKPGSSEAATENVGTGRGSGT